MARILDRNIDYVLGPISMLCVVAAGIVGLDTQVTWLVMFSIAGVGGTNSTLSYAAYMSMAYQKLSDPAAVAFPSRARL